MNDAEFLEAFESRTLPKTEFNHRGHIRAAWTYVQAHGPEGGLSYFRQALLSYVASVGASGIYNETLTCVWMHLVAKASPSPDLRDGFEGFLRQNPRLLDRRYPFDFYAEETLASDLARAQRVEPDRKPLP